MLHELDAIFKQVQQMPTETPPKYHVLYTWMNQPYAVGPFPDKRTAEVWTAGLTHGNEERLVVLGIAQNFVASAGINEREPKLT